MINVEMSKVAGVTLATKDTICNDNVNVTIAHSENLISENIKKDVQIADIVGTLESGGDDSTLIGLIQRDVTKVVIPDGVKSIGQYIFYDCRSLKSITIPNSITSIGNSAFNYCLSLTGAIRIPHGCKTIGQYAFCDCRRADELYLPNTLTYIGTGAFWDCDWLDKVTLENEFNCSVDLSGSDDFYEDDVEEWFIALADRTGLTANKITIHQSLLDDLSSSTIAIATNKNWTVAGAENMYKDD